MRLEDLDYELPPELIAQHPAARREDSRLLIVDRAAGTLTDQRFSDLGLWLRAGDVLALNETRVRPARLAVAFRNPPGRVVFEKACQPARSRAKSPPKKTPCKTQHII